MQVRPDQLLIRLLGEHVLARSVVGTVALHLDLCQHLVGGGDRHHEAGVT